MTSMLAWDNLTTDGALIITSFLPWFGFLAGILLASGVVSLFLALLRPGGGRSMTDASGRKVYSLGGAGFSRGSLTVAGSSHFNNVSSSASAKAAREVRDYEPPKEEPHEVAARIRAMADPARRYETSTPSRRYDR